MNFRDVVGYEGLYQVSDTGVIKRLKSKGCLKERILKTWLSHGYKLVSLYKNGIKNNCHVHRIVATAFLINKDKPEVNHINGIKTDNSVKNLEWVTTKENAQHAFKTGLRSGKVVRGTLNGQSKLTEKQVIEIIRKNQNGESYRSLSREYKVSDTHISRICKRQRWQWIKITEKS